MTFIPACSPSVVVFTNPYELPLENDRILGLLHSGLHQLHIYKPRLDRRAFIDFLHQIPPVFHPRLVLHQHVDVASRFDVGGVLLPSGIGSRVRAAIARMRRPGIMIYATTRNPRSVIPLNRWADRVLLGPVAQKMGEASFRDLLSPADLRLVLQHHGAETIAIGGVYPETIDGIRDRGFGAVALQGAVWKTDDPVQSFLDLADTRRTMTDRGDERASLGA